MSSRILICTNCQVIAALVELPADTVLDLVRAAAGGCVFGPNWQVKAYWCAHCDTPILQAWPGCAAVEARRELVGLPANLLKVDEEGGPR